MTMNPMDEQRAAGMPFVALAGRAVLDPASGIELANWARGCTTAASTAKRPARLLGRPST